MNAQNFFAELKRRNVYKVAIAYGVVAWLLIQVSDTVFPRLNLPDWAVTLVIVLVILGFPVALVLAWAFELTPESVARAEDVAHDKSTARKTGRKLTVAVVLMAAVAAAMFAFSFVRPKAPSIVDGGRTSLPDKSIAVLPFENRSGDAEIEYISDGIPEALINSLTTLRGLRVMARSTAFRYKGREIDPPTIGRELGVRTLLMGSVRQIGDRLNVQVDLVDTASGAQLWGEEYEREIRELVAVKQSIAREVTEKLRVKLSGAEEQQLVRRDPANSEAYQFYLRGRFYWNKRTAENIRRAQQEFQKAIERDPNFALGYVGLADSYVMLTGYAGLPSGETLPQAKAAAERALQIDDSLAEAHASLANIYLNFWRWPEAEREFERAISLNPNYATAHHWFANYLFVRGQLDRALAEIRRAQELDPLAPIIATTMADIYLARNDIISAIEQCRRALEIDPKFPSAHMYLGWAHLKQQRTDEAISEFEKAVELSGRAGFNLSDLGHAYALAGKRAEALALLQELKEKYDKRQATGMHVAGVYTGLGDHDQAFAWLEREFQQRNGELPILAIEHRLAPLRTDPRYLDLLRRMGLAP